MKIVLETSKHIMLKIDRETYERIVPLLAILPIVQTGDPAQQVEHIPDSPPQRHDEKELLDHIAYTSRLRDIDSWIASFTEYYCDYNAPMRGDEAPLTWREDAAKIINATYWDIVRSDIRPKMRRKENGQARIDHHKIISVTEIVIMMVLPIEHPDRKERAFLNALFATFVANIVFGSFCPHLREFMNESALNDFQREHMTWLMNLHTNNESLPFFSNASTHYLLEMTMIKMAEKMAEVVQSREFTVEAIANLVEAKDEVSGKHVVRTQKYMRILTEEMIQQGIYSNQLDKDRIKLLLSSAPLHDIGKIGVPDEILKAERRLTSEEQAEMKKHPIIGGRALKAAAKKAIWADDFLQIAQEIVFYHHEWWDGTGYPEGRAGEDIPLCARLMAFADTYDAARFKRQYKPAKSHAVVVQEMIDETGTKLDPAITPAFLAVADQFEEIARQFAEDA